MRKITYPMWSVSTSFTSLVLFICLFSTTNGMLNVFFWTPYPCLVFQQRHIQNPFKHLRWSVFAYPVNNSKVLTVYTKALHLICLKEFQSASVFRLHVIMFFWKLYQQCLRNTRRGRDSSPSSLLTRCKTHTPWRTTSTFQTNGIHHHFFIWIPIL